MKKKKQETALEDPDRYILEQHDMDHTSLPVLYNRKHPVPYLHVEHIKICNFTLCITDHGVNTWQKFLIRNIKIIIIKCNSTFQHFKHHYQDWKIINVINIE